MNDITGIRGTGSFMALGANVCMPPDWIHRRVVVIDTGDRLSPVALPTSKIGPSRMNISGFSDVAVFTASAPVEFNTLVGVRQARAISHRGSGWAVGEKATPEPRNTHKWALMTGPDLILFIIAGADLVLLIPPDGRGYFFLGERRSGD
jgi:hypothetical protein